MLGQLPVILLVGKAGAGKDAVAARLVEKHGAVRVALADPLKQLAKSLGLGFTDRQLWGPSEARAEEVDVTHWFTQDSIQTSRDHTLEDFAQEEWGLTDTTKIYEANEAWYLLLSSEASKHGGKLSARYVLQTLGTEWGRRVCPTGWLDINVKTCRRLLTEENLAYYPYEGLTASPAARPAYDLVVVTDGRFRNEVVGHLAAGSTTVNVIRDQSTVAGEAAQHASEAQQDGIHPRLFHMVLRNDGTLDDLDAGTDLLVESLQAVQGHINCYYNAFLKAKRP